MHCSVVYYIEIRYKFLVNNTKQDSERATQNIFWRAQTILDMGQNSGKSQFCLFLSKLCLKTHLESDLFGVQYVFCLFNLGLCLFHRMDVRAAILNSPKALQVIE